jgi:hypothetical protein
MRIKIKIFFLIFLLMHFIKSFMHFDEEMICNDYGRTNIQNLP